MAATRRAASKKNDPFAKKIPENPKYKNVQCTVDTGASVNNYMKKIEDIRKNYRFKKDEIFKRMKVSTFAQLVLQVAQVVNMQMEDDEEASDKADIPPLPLESAREGSETERSSLQTVIAGMGEVDITQEDPAVAEVEQKTSAPDPESLPFILLDVREKDMFDVCHIIGALNYPSTMLSRSCNYFTKEINNFKNKPGKIIIVYDEDEKIAPHVATVMVQKEVDNVIMLSGGMKVLHKKFPGCFLRGKLPETCFSPQVDRKGKPKPIPELIQNKSVEWYTPELLEEIDACLDEVLLSNETSRMSPRSTTSTTSRQNTARSERSATSDKVWK